MKKIIRYAIAVIHMESTPSIWKTTTADYYKQGFAGRHTTGPVTEVSFDSSGMVTRFETPSAIYVQVKP